MGFTDQDHTYIHTYNHYGSQATHSHDKLSFELEAAQSELSRLRREKDVMHSKLRETELLCDSEKRFHTSSSMHIHT